MSRIELPRKGGLLWINYPNPGRNWHPFWNPRITRVSLSTYTNGNKSSFTPHQRQPEEVSPQQNWSFEPDFRFGGSTSADSRRREQTLLSTPSDTYQQRRCTPSRSSRGFVLHYRAAKGNWIRHLTERGCHCWTLQQVHQVIDSSSIE